jgi:hypothetical protein
MAAVMFVNHLPFYTESSYVFTELFHGDKEKRIKEIYTHHPNGGTCAWVVFHKAKDAQHAVSHYDRQHFGPVGQRIATSLCSEDSIPAREMNLLTDFIRNRENQIPSCTVKITNFPENHTGRNLNQLLEPVYEESNMHVEVDDPYYGNCKLDKIVHAKVLEPRVALVQLAEPEMANSIVWRFAGTYWKNATLNACCVPDEEMENLLAIERNSASGKDVMLFVTGFRPGTSSTEILNIFKEFSVNDVNIPPSSNTFCFIFLRQEDANAVLARFGPGVRHGGRMIRVGLSDKGKKKGGGKTFGSAPVAALPAPFFATTDLKVNNLPYGVADSNIRHIFESFRLSRVVVKEGYAFVGIASDEAQRAIGELKGKKVGHRVITLKVAERRK